jgi:hypothetical protein
VFSTLQLWKPALHAMLHAPAVQVGVPLFVLHGALHPPQFVVLVLVFASQPSRLVFSVLQLLYPALQLVMLHSPDAHDPTPFALLHELPHAPQFPKEVFRFTSHPSRLALSVLQFPKPALQLVMAHDPLAQTPTPLALLQLVPQVPQFPNDVLVFVSQPSRDVFSLALQLPYPAAQLVIVHALATQAPTPFVLLQEDPHTPQLAKVVRRSVSQPFRVVPSVSQLP